LLQRKHFDALAAVSYMLALASGVMHAMSYFMASWNNLVTYVLFAFWVVPVPFAVVDYHRTGSAEPEKSGAGTLRRLFVCFRRGDAFTRISLLVAAFHLVYLLSIVPLMGILNYKPIASPGAFLASISSLGIYWWCGSYLRIWRHAVFGKPKVRCSDKGETDRSMH
jgi:hypothetical protein